MRDDKDRTRRNGLRVYGAWAGNPGGTLEDTSKCVQGVWSEGRGALEHQCNRNRGHGPGGLYCKQHDPEEVAKRAEARAEKYRKEREFQNRKNTALAIGYMMMKAGYDTEIKVRALLKGVQ